MHELALMDSLVTTVVERVREGQITRVRLEVGRLAGVVPDALRFCFDVCTRGTAMEGAVLDIVDIPGRGRCADCCLEIPMDDRFVPCACGGADIELLTGEELRIREVEVV
jgi:hydrogenase nickel incorporation protein HypA/HybF